MVVGGGSDSVRHLLRQHGVEPGECFPVEFGFVFAVCLLIFLWPAVKDLYAVWRASLRNRDPATSRSGISLPNAVPPLPASSRLSGCQLPSPVFGSRTSKSRLGTRITSEDF